MVPVGMQHAPALQRHFAHWHIIRHLSLVVPWPYPEDGVETYLRDSLLPAIAAGKTHSWALVPKNANPGGEAVGLLDWRCAPDSTDHRGFWIAKEWQGQGLMTEAVIAFQDWVFFDRGIERLVVHSAVRNDASRRVKEKTGARVLGVVELAHHDGVTETFQWEITAESWRKVRGR